MAVTHTIVGNWIGAAGATLTSYYSFTFGEEVNYSSNGNLAIGTNVAIAYVFPHSTLKSIYFLASTAMTIKVNSSGSPDVTITLVAGIPYQWNTAMGFANPFPNDVTVLYVTNAVAGQLDIRALVNI